MDVLMALLNYRDGGLGASGYDFEPLCAAMEALPEAPAVIVICEGNRWHYDGSAGLLGACAALDERLGRPYVGRTGWHPSGPYGPAILWDPQVLSLRSWTGDPHETNAVHERNTARFVRRGRPDVELEVLTRHYAFAHAPDRQRCADEDAEWADGPVPRLLAGDLNEQASGAWLPARDFSAGAPGKRRHKGVLTATGWTGASGALDTLIGIATEQHLRRRDGAGWRALCEVAAAAGVPAEQAFRPTTNHARDPLIIDWILANPAALELLDPTGYGVVLPPPDRAFPATWPLDHRAVRALLTL
ncbi:hypothetical protein AB0A63_31615 [Lentzea sp. NPDC042327]|uniref:hypothetical protein n=1 Tax=Lentzea sp. NPDC042327 TaxID=3154801 RepID=UPI0033CFB369